MSGRRGSALPDLVWLAPDFAIGSKPYTHQRDAIVAFGIRTVVTLDEPSNAEVLDWGRRGVGFVTLSTTDWIGIPFERFDRAVAIIGEHRAAGRKVLLHCLAGQNRAPTVAAAVLCHASDATVDEVLAAIRRIRLISAPTDEQEKSLRHWVDLRCRTGKRSDKKMDPAGEPG